MTASLSVQEKQSNFLEKYISSAREKLKGYEYYKFQFTNMRLPCEEQSPQGIFLPVISQNPAVKAIYN